jgi:hypothetical protein
MQTKSMSLGEKKEGYRHSDQLNQAEAGRISKTMRLGCVEPKAFLFVREDDIRKK